ncbi:hypothetical protein Tco_0193680 [Tanacetum coccineum]
MDRNAELMKKFEDAQKRVEHVQESTQRIHIPIQGTLKTNDSFIFEHVDPYSFAVEGVVMRSYWKNKIIGYGGKHKGKNTQHRENVESCKNSAKAGARNAELMKKFEDAQKRAEHVQESTQRLEEKLSNIEYENQVLCQQAPTMSPTGKSLYARQKTENQ